MFMKTMMNVEQVCEVLEVSDKTVRRIMARGQINYHRVAGQIRFTPFDVSDYLLKVRNK